MNHVQSSVIAYAAPRTFDIHAATYDAARSRLIPPFEAFYGTAIDALGLGRVPPARVLDLGAGTGLLSAFVRDAYPQAELTLLDGAPAMLAQARERLGFERVEFVEADLADPLPAGGPWDAVVSALAIHHLSDPDKRTLFRRVHTALAPGGAFVNAEQVAAPTPELQRHYEAWHEAQARAAGSDDAEWRGALERMRHDRCATVEEHLAWLGEAGFADADCLFKDRRFAVLVGYRGPRP